ncbi:hypothetical protein JOC36_000950 [Weissella uvarum]|uniref:hypothetical protein n=1 Tax=Weissella uvarum TaxID=1479233 RepID=UPI001961ACC1|nr:hypothetical protein [Weissella uvarum]MBM7617393.1 hypothetical protein [Weissella uvarum]MCM0595723.1 hypothetical protein [Weissella uvarum]
MDHQNKDFSLKAFNTPIKNNSDYLEYKTKMANYASSSSVVEELVGYRKPTVLTKDSAKDYKVKSLNRTGVHNSKVKYLVVLSAKGSDDFVLELTADLLTNQITSCVVDREVPDNA